MRGRLSIWLIMSLGLALSAPAVRAEPPGRITGVGGVFFRSKDPKALTAWYRDVLGLKIEAWGGSMLRYDAPGHPPMVVWSAFPEKNDEMEGSTREFMVNFGVDDLDAFLIKLKAKGVAPIKREADGTGAFAWIMDPDGTKIELWQPVTKPDGH